LWRFEDGQGLCNRLSVHHLSYDKLVQESVKVEVASGDAYQIGVVSQRFEVPLAVAVTVAVLVG